MSPLMREATSGGPWKPIYDRLSQSAARTPEESYVLAEILRVCGDAAATVSFPRADMREEAKASFAASISEKDPAREKRVAAWTRMTESRCIGFEGLKTSAGEIRALLDKAAAGGDAKARARVVEKDIWASVVGPGGTMQRTEMSTPSITDAQLATLREAVASNDPQALMIAGRVLSSTMSDLSIRAGPQERPVDPRAFYDAWNLAACDAGYDCGPTSPQMLMACSAQGNCDAQDLREYLFYYNNSPQQSQLVVEYQSQIARAIQTGDWAYFQFVRARPPAGMIYGFGQP
jgi:hypothetical protein